MAIPIILGGMAASALAGYLINEFFSSDDFEDGRKKGEQETKAKYSGAFKDANQRSEEATLYFNRVIASCALSISIINYANGKVTADELEQVKDMISGSLCDHLPEGVTSKINKMRTNSPSVKEAVTLCFKADVPREHTYKLMLDMIDDETEQHKFIRMFDAIYHELTSNQKEESKQESNNVDHAILAPAVSKTFAFRSLFSF